MVLMSGWIGADPFEGIDADDQEHERRCEQQAQRTPGRLGPGVDHRPIRLEQDAERVQPEDGRDPRLVLGEPVDLVRGVERGGQIEPQPQDVPGDDLQTHDSRLCDDENGDPGPEGGP